MKLKLILLSLCCISIQAYAQTNNTLSVMYGTATDGVDIHGSIGDFGYSGRGGTAFGLNYERHLTNSFSLETGLIFTNDKAVLTSILPGNPAPQNVTYNLVSIPVIAKYTFFKYIFIDGGVIADFETNKQFNTLTNSQSGIGVEFGLGVKYSFGRLTVSVNPYSQYHDIVPFSKNASTFNLVDAGYKFGVGYDF